VGGRDCDDINAFLYQLCNVVDDSVGIEGAVGFAVGRDGRSTAEAEVFVAGGFDRIVGIPASMRSNIAEGEESAEAVIVVHHQEFVNAEVFREEIIGGLDGVLG
jgi:hypothetical protein